MSAIDTISVSLARQISAVAGADVSAAPVRGMARRLAAALLAWAQKRDGRRVLRDLTDEQLRDIGISRSEASREVAKSFFWD